VGGGDAIREKTGSTLRIEHIGTYYGSGPEPLPLKITDGDIKRKPALAFQGCTHTNGR